MLGEHTLISTAKRAGIVDRFSAEKRSLLMSKVRRKNTAPELAVRRILYALGYRYRLHVKGLPGTPDIVFSKRKKAVFVHGCFWHGHHGCKLATKPKSSTSFWTEKIANNQMRDTRNLNELLERGWSPLVIWQCELKVPAELQRKLVQFLGPTRMQLG